MKHHTIPMDINTYTYIYICTYIYTGIYKKSTNSTKKGMQHNKKCKNDT